MSADTADTAQTDVTAAPAVQPSASGFEGLGLSAATLTTLARLGHDTPTAVQTQAIPVLLAGHDLLVSAETGSGKTGAFLLPAIQKLAEPSTGARGAPRVLVLAPTRELALQVEVAAQRYGRHLKRLRTVSLIGGAPFGPQLRALSEGVDIVVATPGRLADHLERGRVDLSAIGLLVLDEADRMLDMGFVDEIVAICERLPATRQTVLFSATLDARIGTVASRVTRDPRRIEVAARTDAGTLTQVVHHVDHLQHKLQVLDAILGRGDVAQAIVFAGTKVAAEELAMRLRDDGRQAAALHGDMPQSARDRVVRNLRQGRVGVLVATDVAARGIDVPTISHVINFDLPMKAEDYVHRIGRTARAGRSGTSVTLVGARDRRLLAGIERLLRNRIPVEVLPGLEPRTAQASPRRPAEHRGGPGRSAPWNRDAGTAARPPYRASGDTSHRSASEAPYRASGDTSHRGASEVPYRGAADTRPTGPRSGPSRGGYGAERRDGPPSRRPAGGTRRRHTD